MARTATMIKIALPPPPLLLSPVWPSAVRSVFVGAVEAPDDSGGAGEGASIRVLEDASGGGDGGVIGGMKGCMKGGQGGSGGDGDERLSKPSRTSAGGSGGTSGMGGLGGAKGRGPPTCTGGDGDGGGGRTLV